MGEERGRDILERASPTWSFPLRIATAGMPRTLTVSFWDCFGGAVLCMALFGDVNMIRRALPRGGRTGTRKTYTRRWIASLCLLPARRDRTNTL